MGRPLASTAVRRDLAQLLTLAWPVVLSRLGIMTMGLTDAIVVGRYSARELGYHALGWAPTSVIVTVCVGVLVGVQVMTARAVGEGRRQESGAVLRRGLSYSLLIGVIATAILGLGGPPFMNAIGLEPDLARGATRVLLIFTFSMPAYAVSVAAGMWLEGLGRPGPAAAAMWVANLVNLVLVVILVPGMFGLPALGAAGAAWGTFGARTFLAVATLAYIALMPEARALGVFRKPPREPVLEAEQRRIGFGAGASNFFEVAAFAGMNVIAGWMGGLAVAAWAIVLNVTAIIFMIPLGLATASAVLVGRAYGARDLAGVNRAGGVAFGLTVALSGLIALVLWPFAGLIVHGYTADAATIAMAAPALALVCVMFVPDALQVVTAQVLRARGDVWAPTSTHLASYVAVMIPLAWWLAIPRGMGVSGIVWAVIIASFMAMTLLLGRFWLLRRKL